MSGTYTTTQGDTWDGIAHKALGDAIYMDRLMAINPRHLETYIFPAGVVLRLPDIETVTISSSLPPWKQVSAIE